MITDNDLGIIEFIRSDRAKHIRVRVLPAGLKVSLPDRASKEDALKFINSIRNRLVQKQAKLVGGLQKNNILIDENSCLQTLTFAVKVKRSPRPDIYCSLKSNLLTIEFPQSTNCNEKKTQEYFWNGIGYFLRKEANRVLPERTKFLAEKFGFSFSAVKIRNSKSRWGSCSRAQSINFSYFLLLLPAHLIDYVILHELCHTKEMNHGVNFWIWMDRVTNGKSKEYRKEMKNYHMPS